jgi:hypothetical protein
MKTRVSEPYEPVRWETIQEFCDRLRISRRTYDDLQSQGIIPVIRTSQRLIRIDPKLADQALAEFLVGGKGRNGDR